jgi:dolichol-phosphate mannosyltransferase
LSFYLVCSVVAMANKEFADLLYQKDIHWVIAGDAGAFIGAIWNYELLAIFTWKKPKTETLMKDLINIKKTASKFKL